MIFKSNFVPLDLVEMPLTDYVLENVRNLGDKPAFIDGPSGRTVTYGQLVGGIDRIAATLADKGFKKGDVFMIISPNLPEYPMLFHGVCKAGGICTTANPLYTADELAHQMTHSKAKYALTVAPFLDKVNEAAGKTGVEEVFVFGEAEGASPFTDLLVSTNPPPTVSCDPKNDLVVLPYSSGTTGLPKGVMLSHYNLTTNVAQTMAIEKVTIDDTLIGMLPFFHIYGMTVLMNICIRLGATVVTLPRFDLEQFLTIMQDYKVTRAPLVPPIILGLAKHPMVDKFDLSNLVLITSGAAPLGDDLAGACAARLDCRVKQGYGLTETSPVTHLGLDQAPDPDNPKYGSIGMLVPNTECRVVDVASGKDVATNERGEIWLRGPQVMQGYLNNQAATDGCIDSDGWFHTGDVAYVDEEGFFYIVDRAKELIKYKGMQVAPAELEALLLSHPLIADAAVIPSPNDEAGEVPKAYVVLKPLQTASEEEIMAWVAERVAPHKKIRLVEFTTEIPKSASGKILRRILRDKENERIANLTS